MKGKTMWWFIGGGIAAICGLALWALCKIAAESDKATQDPDFYNEDLPKNMGGHA